ncbi:hypothetical protein [Pseudoalteromonas distincta]|uniref:hypothetical protein n=1 Tax=Pseudoalteromonas distincta TaxID=77608 RepID=UPI00241CEBB3|nr:hypothetical protein [Pseudoalteromonas distincta]
MSAFNINMECFLAPFSQDIDELLYGEESASNEFKEWQSWNACIYDCILKAKELFAKVEDLQAPLVWLLPALEYQGELKHLLANSLKQLFPQHVSHILFYGATGANAMIELVQKNQWKKVNVLAVDATHKANINGEYTYQGVGGALATVIAVKTGWMQQSHELAPSVDFIKHNQLSGIFSNIALNSKKQIDFICAPGNGVNHESDVWLTNLQLLSNLISEHTHYELPNYKLGKIGALEGLVNLYQLTSSPAIVNHYKHALVISQEQSKYQAAASYLWISEEVHN